MQTGYHALSNKRIKISDPLYGHYVDMIADTVLPYQWDIFNDRIDGAPKSHCLDNFRIAAGDLQGAFYGVVFQDSDAYKWLEAVSYCIESGQGEKFSVLADEVIDLIVRAQQSDGYLDTYFIIEKPEQRWSNLIEGHELYCAGHLIEAGVAYHMATGKRALLDVSIRFADLITKTFGTQDNQIHGYPGHQEIELALVKLYRATGDKKYLETARYFIEQRGKTPNYFLSEMEKRNGSEIFHEFNDYDLKYSQAHKPPFQQQSIEGHAVRAMYMCSAMADLALEYDDASMKDVCLSLWKSATENRMFITGGLGSSGHLERFTTDYDLPNTSAYCETCASVGLMMFGQRMASLTGDARYYDEVERALCNTVLAGIQADGSKYFYVNPLEVWPDACQPFSSMAHVKPERQKWFNVACCPTNVARTLASLGQYIYAESEGTLYIHQFISSHVIAGTSDSPVNVCMEANILGSGLVKISTDASIQLRVRIPSYAEKTSYVLNEKAFDPVVDKGYAVFVMEGNAYLVLDFHIVPRWVAANNLVRSDMGKVAPMFGPFVYCLEEKDNHSNLASVVVMQGAAFESSDRLIDLPGNMPALAYDGYRMESGVDGLYGTAAYHLQQEHLRAIPYCLWCNRTPGEMVVWQKVCFS